MITASAIKRFRKKYDVSREELAVEVGVSAQTIWRWETGGTIPRPEQRMLETIMESMKNGS